MPAIIDSRLCDNSMSCGSARFCPKGAIVLKPGNVSINSDLCGDCPGHCVRGCPAKAVKYAPADEFEALLQDMKSDTRTEADLFEEMYGVKPVDPGETGRNLIHLDCGNWNEKVLESPVPVIVDFWAPWCQPCKVLAPHFKKLAEEYEGKILFGKMNTEECQQIPAQLYIRSIPTLMVFFGGKPVDMAVGALPEGMLRDFLDKQVKSLNQ